MVQISEESITALNAKSTIPTITDEANFFLNLKISVGYFDNILEWKKKKVRVSAWSIRHI